MPVCAKRTDPVTTSAQMIVSPRAEDRLGEACNAADLRDALSWTERRAVRTRRCGQCAAL